MISLITLLKEIDKKLIPKIFLNVISIYKYLYKMSLK